MIVFHIVVLNLYKLIFFRVILKFVVIITLRLCLRVWRGREGKAWEKRNEQVEEIEENGRGGLWGVSFSS